MHDFEEIYQLYSPKIFRVCMGYVNDNDQARDLTQETFIAVWQNLASFRDESKISTWIFRIATNNCLRSIEKAKRFVKTELPANLPDLEEVGDDAKLQFLYACIAELEEADRLLISLFLEDMPQAEIAQVIGISHANVRIKVHRIKEKLSLKFKKHGAFE